MSPTEVAHDDVFSNLTVFSFCFPRVVSIRGVQFVTDSDDF